ncbi:CLUMA_CG001009, isoform A [Clunio marinus]|uniref:CLUMA_CG001009, isoform A n=1 Tax=Clunio marinus TaxID=568069 RepID=A0A1J1HGT1_9DIPT|nr:CLUMA_CG001009, isoform A [Clunio marinus]
MSLLTLHGQSALHARHSSYEKSKKLSSAFVKPNWRTRFYKRLFEQHKKKESKYVVEREEPYMIAYPKYQQKDPKQ